LREKLRDAEKTIFSQVEQEYQSVLEEKD
jgi:hypothetical protein